MLEVRPIEATDEALLAGTCKEFLPEYVGRAAGGVGVVVIRLAEAEACWSAVRGTRKEDGLGSLEGAVVRGV